MCTLDSIDRRPHAGAWIEMLMHQVDDYIQQSPPRGGLDLAALKRTCRAEETLPAAFPDAREQFQAFQSTRLDLLSLMAYHKFAQGFAMGMQRAVGAMHDKEDTPPRSDPPACPSECSKKVIKPIESSLFLKSKLEI